MTSSLVFLGAGIGGALRHAVNVGCARYCGTAFPWGTLAVNVVGSFIMGASCRLARLQGRRGLEPAAAAVPDTGILGGFTTFSAFSLDAVLIWERGAAGLAVAYVGASVLLSLPDWRRSRRCPRASHPRPRLPPARRSGTHAS